MSFVNVFGGSTVQPADVAFRALTLTADLAVQWPTYSLVPEDLLARIMQVTANTAALSITLPPANQVSTGQDVLFRNDGSETFTVLDAAGNTVATVAPSEDKYLYIADNTTEAGVWEVVLFGASASQVDAAALAGLGLEANGARLQLAEPAALVSADFTIDDSDRASVFAWTGGTGTITLPSAASATNTFFFSIRNAGTGVLAIAADGGETIDDSASISLQPGDSCVVQSSGLTSWFTVGRGRNQQFNFTLLVKNITGGTVTLTPTEASNVVQRYTGTLTSNAEIVLPSVVQVYYVSNQTSGAFTVTFRTAGVGTQVSVPAGQNAVLFCDGLNIINNSTTVSGLTSLLLQQGTVTTPSIAYSGDSSTGIYQPATGTVAVTTSGVERGRFSGDGLKVIGRTEGGNGAAATPSFTFTSDLNTGLFSAGADLLGVAVGGAEVARFQSAGLQLNTLALSGITNLTTTGNTVLGDASTDTLNVGAGGLVKDANGRVGINKIPAGLATLEIAGTARVDGGAGTVTPLVLTGGLANFQVSFLSGGGVAYLVNSGADGFEFQSGSAVLASISNAGALYNGAGLELGYRDIPAVSASTDYTLTAAERGKMLVQGGSHTTVGIPVGVFSAGATISIFNNTGVATTIQQNIGLTLMLAGTSFTGNRTLAARGMATIWYRDGSTAIVSGAGVS